MTFKFRGHKTFYFSRKRFKPDALRGRMAENRTCYPGGGGSYDAETGDGEAWSKVGDRFKGWQLVRKIKAGQWFGPWIRTRNDA